MDDFVGYIFRKIMYVFGYCILTCSKCRAYLYLYFPKNQDGCQLDTKHTVASTIVSIFFSFRYIAYFKSVECFKKALNERIYV